MALVAPFSTVSLPQPAASVAQGLLALLEEEEPELQEHALEQLYHIVDQHWAEVANKVPLIEAISEDPNFAKRELAAAVASRCFFHLEEYNDALRLALGAGHYLFYFRMSKLVELLRRANQAITFKRYAQVLILTLLLRP
jgi:hypothetical protein